MWDQQISNPSTNEYKIQLFIYSTILLFGWYLEIGVDIIINWARENSIIKEDKTYINRHTCILIIKRKWSKRETICIEN